MTADILSVNNDIKDGLFTPNDIKDGGATHHMTHVMWDSPEPILPGFEVEILTHLLIYAFIY